ncbi:hypothetical protein [Pseudomonas anguilliseptica]|uniref:hypothetical protein n=1 Tax=Pseudomonas anguilliseptica TaxID=53406 RepID=UPI001114A887|nr:hypothetical protein [Pseudomonas anguilliseptica]
MISTTALPDADSAATGPTDSVDTAGDAAAITVTPPEGSLAAGQDAAVAPAGDAASSTVLPSSDPAPTTTYRVVGLDLMIDGKLIPENGTVELDYEPSAKTLRRLEPVIKKKEGNQ